MMKNESNLEDRQNFRINPQVWLQTLLAVTGDKEKKEEFLQKVVQETGCPLENVEALISVTIKILMNQTRSN